MVPLLRVSDALTEMDDFHELSRMCAGLALPFLLRLRAAGRTT